MRPGRWPRLPLHVMFRLGLLFVWASTWALPGHDNALADARERPRTSSPGQQNIQRESLKEYLSQQPQLFVGTVTAARAIQFVPSGTCGQGLSELKASEFTVSVEQTLQGAMLNDVEVVRSLRTGKSLQPVVGTVVLAYGTRICEDNWRMWGDVIEVRPDGTLAGYGPMANELANWEASSGQRVRLQDAIAALTELRATAPLRPFEEVKDLATVIVKTKTITRPPQGIVLGCDIISSTGSIAPQGTLTVQFLPPDNAPCRTLTVGDTLVIPIGAAVTDTATFAVCANHMRVAEGYLASLGVRADSVASAFARTPNGNMQLRVRSTRPNE